MPLSADLEQTLRGTRLFPIGYYRVEPGHPRYQMPLHWHPEYELIRVTSGRFLCTVDGRNFSLSPGDCLAVGSGSVHGGAADDCRYECLVFDPSFFLPESVLGQTGGCFVETFLISGSSPFAGLADRLFREVRDKKTGCEWFTTGLLWQWIGLFCRSAAPQAEGAPPAQKQNVASLKQVLSFIRNHYRERLSLSDLAEQAGLSPRYFCRVFRALTGKTPVAYLNYYRLEQASRQLLESRASITEVAYSCGFSDLSYFSNCFKKEFGVSAGQWRNHTESASRENKSSNNGSRQIL